MALFSAKPQRKTLRNSISFERRERKREKQPPPVRDKRTILRNRRRALLSAECTSLSLSSPSVQFSKSTIASKLFRRLLKTQAKEVEKARRKLKHRWGTKRGEERERETLPWVSRSPCCRCALISLSRLSLPLVRVCRCTAAQREEVYPAARRRRLLQRPRERRNAREERLRARESTTNYYVFPLVTLSLKRALASRRLNLRVLYTSRIYNICIGFSRSVTSLRARARNSSGGSLSLITPACMHVYPYREWGEVKKRNTTYKKSFVVDGRGAPPMSLHIVARTRGCSGLRGAPGNSRGAKGVEREKTRERERERE